MWGSPRVSVPITLGLPHRTHSIKPLASRQLDRLTENLYRTFPQTYLIAITCLCKLVSVKTLHTTLPPHSASLA